MNQYLEKIALTRLVKELALGNVSTSVPSLLRSGSIRGPSRYAKGMKRGSTSISNKANADITRVKDLSTYQGEGVVGSGGYATFVSTDGKIHVCHNKGYDGVIHVGPGKSRKGISHQSGIMHEAFESQYLRKNIEEGLLDSDLAKNTKALYLGYKGIPGIDKDQLHHTNRFLAQVKSPITKGLIIKNGVEKAKHQSIAVLGKESNMVRANPYLRNSGYQSIRQDSGESEYIKKLTGKRYGMDKFTGSDLRRLDLATPTRIENGNHIHEV